jgi:hypothetical protein
VERKIEPKVEKRWRRREWKLRQLWKRSKEESKKMHK